MIIKMMMMMMMIMMTMPIFGTSGQYIVVILKWKYIINIH